MNKKYKIDYLDTIFFVIIFPFLLVYWVGVGIIYIQGRVNYLREQIEKEQEKANKNK